MRVIFRPDNRLTPRPVVYTQLVAAFQTTKISMSQKLNSRL